MNIRTSVAPLSSVLAFAATSVPVLAQTSDRELAEPLLACRETDDRADRLDCFNRAMDTLYGVDEVLAKPRIEQKQARFGRGGSAAFPMGIESFAGVGQSMVA